MREKTTVLERDERLSHSILWRLMRTFLERDPKLESARALRLTIEAAR